MRILVVDDEPNIRSALIKLLEGMGHTTCWAATGEAAMGLMHSEKLDLIILDMLLGRGMSGWDVAREKLLDPRLRQVPLIVISGLAADDVRAGAKVTSDALSGAMLILPKPIDAKQLEQAIEALDKSRKTPTPEPTD